MSCCCCRRRRRNNSDSAGERYIHLSLSSFLLEVVFSFSAHGTSIWWPERFAEKLGPQNSCLSGSAVDFLDCVDCIICCSLVMFIIIFIAHRTVVEELVEELAGCTYLKLDFPPLPRLELRRCLLLLLLLFWGEWQQPRLVCRDPISQSSFWASVSFRESLDTPVWFARGCLSTREGDIPSRLLLN